LAAPKNSSVRRGTRQSCDLVMAVVRMVLGVPAWLEVYLRLKPACSPRLSSDAGRALLSYLTFHIVETPGAYNALQQLSYAAVVFLLAPFSIATGVAMSPAVAGRFPWYIKIFHGRQGARSLHMVRCSP
jgi:thiosulfate reductase cytochrome b subunit